MRIRSLPLLAAALLLIPAGAAAQTSVNVTSSITIPGVLFIDVDVNTVAFDVPSATDFDDGSIPANNSTVVTHRGNITHDVRIQTAATDMTAASRDASHVKPASDLQWSLDGSTWAGVSTTADDVVDDAAPGTGDVTVQMLLDYTTDQPDTYTLSFTYTVVAS